MSVYLLIRLIDLGPCNNNMSILQVGSMEKKLNEGLTVLLKGSMCFFIDWKIFRLFLKAPEIQMNWGRRPFGVEKSYRLLEQSWFEALQIHLLGMNIPPKQSCSDHKLAFSLGRFPAITSWFLGAYKLQCPAYLQHFLFVLRKENHNKKDSSSSDLSQAYKDMFWHLHSAMPAFIKVFFLFSDEWTFKHFLRLWNRFLFKSHTGFLKFTGRFPACFHPKH